MDPQTNTSSKTLAIIGILLAFLLLSPIGLIISIIAGANSAKVGNKNTLAIIGVILNGIVLIGSFIFVMSALNNGASFLPFGVKNPEEKDSSSYTEIVALDKDMHAYIKEKNALPMQLSDLKSLSGFKEELLTNDGGKPYTLEWSPEGCKDASTCTSYTISTKSYKNGKDISITYDAVAKETTSSNIPPKTTK
jgi:hypothetical protein